MEPDAMLGLKLSQVRKVFNTKEVLALKPDNRYVQKYYRASRVGYSLFYISSDRMYMGISRDGNYKEDDLLEAARTVEKYIKSLGAKNILELATGRGATSAYLAEKYSKIKFMGIELSPAQLSLAKRKARKLTNYMPTAGDYHDLSRYADNSVDVVFVIEALCYSTDKSRVYSEVSRVLRAGGVFIIFDGYTAKSRSKMSENELLACKLTEKTMALSVFEDYDKAMHKARTEGLSLINDEDVSAYILPTLRRFERHAARFFNHPQAAKWVSRFTPKKFIYNAIAGLLMPDVVGRGLLSYHITIFKK